MNVAAAPTKCILIYDAKFASAVAAISGSTASTTRSSMPTHQCFHEGKDEPPAASSSTDKRPAVTDIMCNIKGNKSPQIASPTLTSPSEGQFDLFTVKVLTFADPPPAPMNSICCFAPVSFQPRQEACRSSQAQNKSLRPAGDNTI